MYDYDLPRECMIIMRLLSGGGGGAGGSGPGVPEVNVLHQQQPHTGVIQEEVNKSVSLSQIDPKLLMTCISYFPVISSDCF